MDLKEYLGYTYNTKKDAKDFSYSCTSTNNLKITENTDLSSKNILFTDIEGIHSAPYITRNCTRYSKECLKDMVKNWTYPYKRPLIKHHNEKDGAIIGRITDVKYMDSSTNLPESASLVFTAIVPKEPEATDVQTGLLETVSIGVSSTDVRCSICGQNIAEEGLCEHERGQYYDNELCCWDILKAEPKELSYVVVPSDSFAKALRVYNSNNLKKQSLHEQCLHTQKTPIGGSMDTVEEKELLEAKKKTTEDKEKVEKKKEEEKPVEKKHEEHKEEHVEKKEKHEEHKEEKKCGAEKEIAELKKKIKELEAKVDKLTEKEAQAVASQEEAEKVAIKTKEAYHDFLKKSLNIIRKSNGMKELEESVLNNRSIDSLLDSYNDIVSEYNIKEMKETKVENPALKESEEEKTLEKEANNITEKEKNDKKNINLAEQLEKIFSNVVIQK